jgi:hypothetical protein
MNTSPATYFQIPGSGTKNVWNVVIAMMHSVPPTHSGLEIQYMIWLTPATRRPNASFVHTYGPPSNGNAVPNSATSRPYGTKNATARMIIQVRPCGPLATTEPIVSSPTSVQTRKNRMSNR